MAVEPAVLIAALSSLGAAVIGLARLIYRDLVKDRNFWRDRYLRSSERTGRALATGERLVRGKPDG